MDSPGPAPPLDQRHPEQPAPGDGPVAVVLVRNAVTHDGRVQREVDALRQAGFRPLIVGVQAVGGQRSAAVEGGALVVRVAPPRPWPLRAAAAVLARRRGRAAGQAPAPRAPSAPGPEAAPAPVPTGQHGDPPPATAAPARMTLARRLRRTLVAADYHRQAFGEIRRARPALVHCNDHNTMWTGIAAKLWCRSRLVYDSHELWPDRNGRWEWRPGLIAGEALFVRAADRVITASPGYAEPLARRYRIRRPDVIRNIPAGPPAGPSAGDPPPDDPPVAVYIGGLLRGRGLEQAIDALPAVPGLRLRCIGPGAEPYRAELRARARRRGVEHRVELRDPVAPGEVVDVLRGATMGLSLIQPVCRSYELTLPNKLFEYAAAGVPVVCSRLPVMAQVVSEAGCGVLVDPADVAGIARGMAELLDPARRDACAAGAERLGATATWASERARLSGLYAALGARNTPQR